MVLADSGCRAIASIAAATARPSASAGPMAPNETAKAADRSCQGNYSGAHFGRNLRFHAFAADAAFHSAMAAVRKIRIVFREIR